MSLRGVLKRVMDERGTLERGEARAAMEEVLRGGVPEVELAALLGGLAARGETAEELAGFAEAMRGAAVPLPLTDAERERLVDTCGTGGDGCGTFNISTGAALVAAAAGATVAKHGNRAVTSQCGSADVLEALGVPVDLTGERAAEALRRHGFCFLHAQGHHPAMRAVLGVRRALGVRTAFNVLGPLANPAGARAQVMGVYAGRLVEVAAEAMALLGTRYGLVVHGQADGAGMDEISVCGASRVAEVRDGRVRMFEVTPEELGVRRASVDELAGSDAAGNADILRGIFAGERGARRDAVVVNAAAVLVVAGVATDLMEGVRVAGEAIDGGKVSKLVHRLVD